MKIMLRSFRCFFGLSRCRKKEGRREWDNIRTEQWTWNENDSDIRHTRHAPWMPEAMRWCLFQCLYFSDSTTGCSRCSVCCLLFAKIRIFHQVCVCAFISSPHFSHHCTVLLHLLSSLGCLPSAWVHFRFHCRCDYILSVYEIMLQCNERMNKNLWLCFDTPDGQIYSFQKADGVHNSRSTNGNCSSELEESLAWPEGAEGGASDF